MPTYTLLGRLLQTHASAFSDHSRFDYRRHLEGGNATYSFSSSSLPFYFSKQRTFFRRQHKGTGLGWAGNKASGQTDTAQGVEERAGQFLFLVLFYLLFFLLFLAAWRWMLMMLAYLSHLFLNVSLR